MRANEKGFEIGQPRVSCKLSNKWSEDQRLWHANRTHPRLGMGWPKGVILPHGIQAIRLTIRNRTPVVNSAWNLNWKETARETNIDGEFEKVH